LDLPEADAVWRRSGIGCFLRTMDAGTGFLDDKKMAGAILRTITVHEP
jgi:hypothetical protein